MWSWPLRQFFGAGRACATGADPRTLYAPADCHSTAAAHDTGSLRTDCARIRLRLRCNLGVLHGRADSYTAAARTDSDALLREIAFEQLDHTGCNPLRQIVINATLFCRFLSRAAVEAVEVDVLFLGVGG